MTTTLYEGTKRLHATPMTRGEYNAYRGWENPAGENPFDAGYLVEYQDGGKANDSRHAGYISWSPADVFERTYKPVSAVGMTFGQAIDAIKSGQRIARTGWNGKGMFVYLVPPASYPVQTGAAKEHFGEGAMVPYNAYMAIKNVDNTVSTWVPSVNDCLADDWVSIDAQAVLNNPHTGAPRDPSDVASDPQALLCLKPGEPVKAAPSAARAIAAQEVFTELTASAYAGLNAVDRSEREIQAKAGNRWEQGQAPRVTMDMVNAQIVGETYTVLPSGRVTVCELTLKNGFTVRGESAVVFIENNVPQTGREIARKNAVDQIWPLLGFRLRDELAS